ncbi:MAG: hypothetical protein WA741_21870 [Candidatus Sulfotelmatobacter sp.]
MDYEEKEVKPYKPHELKALFQAADDEERLWMSYFLNTGCREQEVANAEYCDLLDDVNVVWVRSKPHRGFKLKGKRWQNKGRKLPVPTADLPHDRNWGQDSVGWRLWASNASALSEASPWSAVWSGAKVGGARVRKSRQKEAAGAADAGLMQIEWSEGEVLKLE